MGENESCDEFFEKINRLSSELEELGEPIPSKLIVDKLFLRMNFKFEHIITTLEETEMGKRKDHTQLMGVLKNYEMNRLIKKTSQSLGLTDTFKGLAIRDRSGASGSRALTSTTEEVTPLKTYKATVK